MGRTIGVALAALAILWNCCGCLGPPGYPNMSGYSSTPIGGSSYGGSSGYGGGASFSSNGSGFSGSTASGSYRSRGGYDTRGGVADVNAAALSDSALAGALTTYLKHHRLPLVGADVVTNADGSRKVILYGFTATNYGKADAVTKTANFINNSSIAIANRIVVHPALARMHAPAPSGAALASAGGTWNNAPTPAGVGNIQGYERNQNPATYSSAATGSSGGGSWISAIGPIVGIAALAAGALALGGVGGYGGYGGGYPGYGYGGYGGFP